MALNVHIHPTHKRETQIGVAVLSLPGVLAALAGVAGLLGPTSVIVGLATSAMLLLPWIVWRNTRCQCPQCGARLRIDPDSGRPPGSAQLFLCRQCLILWDDRMERDG
jgi:hypothetical protein